MELLRVEHLSKVYGTGNTEVRAVDDVSFTVNKGEFVAIVGASGSGKSTLLHMIGGVDKPTEGSIQIDGVDICKLGADRMAIFRRRQIGVIYQFYNLIPTLNVKENITLPCELDGQKVDESWLKDLMEILGLSERASFLPNELSGGQQQRVAIGRAMMNRPALILADEPTGNLDSKMGEEIVALLRVSNQQFRQTILMITHDMEIAAQADRVIGIADGRIVAC
ncbi:MAG: ABC transporter ATP-binding protein [Lachnospiraceae bacterium]|nr:ABC transporter ATP-binding protein [Lachnospiraceae bacterium]